MENWLEIVLPATPDTIEELEARLAALGFDSIQIEDSRDFSAYREGWDYADDELCAFYQNCCQIRLYLPEDADAPPKIETLRTLVPSLSIASRAEEDWAENWKQYYRPTAVGTRLLIQPAWLPLENPEGRAVFWNNPGMSFGTGLHATTRLCLESLETLPLQGKRVLDIGCGSGILSLCALCLGASEALGLDTDILAADISRKNAAANQLSGRYRSLQGNIIENETLRASLGVWDIVLSNIVADVIIVLAPLVRRLLVPGGTWLVSGIIAPRLPEVTAALAREGYTAEEQRVSEDWVQMRLR